MAQNKNDIQVTERDHKEAAMLNRKAALQRIRSMPDSHFSDFLKRDFKAIQATLKKHAPELYEDSGATRPDALALARAAIDKMSPGTSENLDFKWLRLERITPEQIAGVRIAEEAALKQSRDNAKKAFVSASKNLTAGLYGMASAPVIAAAALGMKMGSSAKKLFVGAADAVHAFYEYGQVSLPTRLATTGAAFAMVPVTLMSQIDAAPFHPAMPGYQPLEINQACTPAMLKMSGANVVYARTFGLDKAPTAERHAAQTMLMSDRHNVPAVALHLVSYFESARFSDMWANNSSASNPFQVINSTKGLYIKTYGKQTFTYQDAQTRIAENSASDMDRSLVNAIDAVSSMPMDAINKMIENKNPTGPVHDALVYADTSLLSAEMVALDLKKKFPEIANQNIEPERILEIVTKYYMGDHFLGAGNHAKLVNIAANKPDMSITDTKGIANYFDSRTANHFQRVVSGNPAFLKEGMTAPEALKSISTNFKAFVQSEYDRFEKHYDPLKTTFDLCVRQRPEGEKLPDYIPRYDALKYTGQMVHTIYTPAPLKDFVTAQFNRIDPAEGLTKGTQARPPAPAQRTASTPAAERFGASKPAPNIPIPTPRPQAPST